MSNIPVLFFPDNKLGASICPIYNDHTAVVTNNTDRLKDNKYAGVELALFRNNLHATAFLNPDAVEDNENVGYSTTLQSVSSSDRISYGLYFRTKKWVNPITLVTEVIPDYDETTWTAAGVAVFSRAVLGAAKTVRTPNHGQEMYTISGGQYGYNVSTQQFGASGGLELTEHAARQLAYFASMGFKLTAGSYENGQTGSVRQLIPKLLGMRTSSFSYSGTSSFPYSSLTRYALNLRQCSTRSWDAANGGFLPSQAASIAYTQTQVAAAIAAGGWFSDFMHWHSLYDFPSLDFAESLFSAMNATIGASDVWRTGHGEAAEYYVLRESIDKVGSFVDGNAVYLSVRFNDGFSGTNTDGISNALPVDCVHTPLSIKVNLTGTPLAGLDIACNQAQSMRNKGGNVWVINILPSIFVNGCYVAKLTAGTGSYFDASVPVLSYSGDLITASLPCKFVVWRKLTGSTDYTIATVNRTTTYATTVTVSRAVGYDYFIGGITRSKMSSVLQING